MFIFIFETKPCLGSGGRYYIDDFLQVLKFRRSLSAYTTLHYILVTSHYLRSEPTTILYCEIRYSQRTVHQLCACFGEEVNHEKLYYVDLQSVWFVSRVIRSYTKQKRLKPAVTKCNSGCKMRGLLNRSNYAALIEFSCYCVKQRPSAFLGWRTVCRTYQPGHRYQSISF